MPRFPGSESHSRIQGVPFVHSASVEPNLIILGRESALEESARRPCAFLLLQEDAVVRAGILESPVASPPRLPGDLLLVEHDSSGMLETIESRIATRELAEICFPDLPDHDLGPLVDSLGLEIPGEIPGDFLDRAGGGRACAHTLDLWRKLGKRVRELPWAVLHEITTLLAPFRGTALQGFFREAEREIRRSRPGELKRRFPDLFPERPRGKVHRTLPGPDERTPIDPEEVADLLGPQGPFASELGNYEYREGQIAMARAVTEAFNRRRHLVAEAGTGIGKSLAYLVPSVLWSRRNAMPVVVSTNTKNLQTQLFHKDLPLLRRALDVEFRAALIKGRSNYLCLRRVEYMLDNASLELNREERLLMAGILVWAAGTATGDVAESGVCNRPGRAFMRGKITSVAEDCSGAECRYWKRCFLYTARHNAANADIVVANHAMVFADMGVAAEGRVLPPHAQIVFDEAHNLEEAAVSWFSREISTLRLRFILNRLWRRGRRRSGAGVLPAILNAVRSKDFRGGTIAAETIARTAEELISAVRGISTPIEAFFETLSALLPARPGVDSRRIDRGDRDPRLWTPILATKQSLDAAVAGIVRGSTELGKHLCGEIAEVLPRAEEYVRETTAAALWLREFADDVEFFLAAGDPEYVFWVERASPREGGVRGWAAPLELGRRFADELYIGKDSIVFTSATLSVRGSFDFVERRLGIDRIESDRILEMRAETPFRYEEQCRVLVPMFLPDPADPDGEYVEELSRLLPEIFRRTRGRALVLFTSYQMLNAVAERLRRSMRRGRPRILVQGVSGSRAEITETFKKDLHSVLLGTHSFWEGVDVVGESLSCLVIARLPFAVFTDPLVEARCEEIERRGENPFFGYSLPSAVIRFRQGFGRLIRHRTDRGIVIVADRRIVTKRYGPWFTGSIPAPTLRLPERDRFLDVVRDFFETDAG